MRVIEWQLSGKKEQWIVYDQEKDAWKKKEIYSASKQQGVYNFICEQNEQFEMALIGLNLSYRNTFYALMPHIHVIIKPSELLRYVMHFYRLSPGYCEESAISMDDSLNEQWAEAEDFVRSLYACQSKEEAMTFYDRWQLMRSQWNPVADKLQTVVEIFKDEIFDFFIYQSVFRAIYSS